MGTTPLPVKRILMTADAVGGVWQYSVDLARELAGRGCEVLIAVLGPAPGNEQLSMLADISRVHLTSACYALEWMENPWTEVARSKEWLLAIENDFHPDVVHLNGYALADAPWSAPAISVAHSCVLSWWQAVNGTRAPAEWSQYERQVRCGLHAAAAVAAPSGAIADAIASLYGIERSAVTVIHNFSSAAAGISSGGKEPFFLAAGRVWDQAKNLALLASIAPRLTWPMAIAGADRGDRKQANAALCYLGRLSRNDLAERMARAAVFVHPALYEPFGLAVLEAARAGCCLVLADIASLRELWEGAAVFVDPHDREGWMGTLNQVAADKSFRQTMADRATTHARRYCAETSVTQYLALYGRALSRAGRQPGAAA